MAKEKKIIPVVFATNEGYAPYAGVTITSIIENSSKEYFYDIYVFYTDLSEDTISRFHQMKGDNFSVTCKDVNSYIDRELLYENFHFSKEMYYRILIPTILSQYDKVIYLDCDMVVLGDLSELYQTDLKGYVLAGVNDVMHKTSKNYVTNVIKLDTNNYINSGMLVINCKEFIKQDIKNKCFKTLAEIDVKLRYPDQDIINITCQNKIKFLDPCWNYIWHYNFPRFNQTPDLLLPEDEQKIYDKRSNNIKILHYTSNIKPWNNYNTIFTEYFFKYVRLTPSFKDIIYDRYNKIGMKNYIVMQYCDILNDKICLTGAYYTIEDYLYNGNVSVRINGKPQKLKYTLIRNIDLRNMCYKQKFFKIELSFEDYKNGVEFTFFRNNRPTEKLAVATGKFFPIDYSSKTKAYFGNYAMSIENHSLIIQRSGRNEKMKYEFSLRKRLYKNFNRSGKLSALVRFVYFLTKPFYSKKIWLISDRMTNADDNGEAFFKFLQYNKPKGVKPYFVINKTSPDYKRLKKYGKVVSPKSKRFYMLYIHCAKNISSQFDPEILEPFNLAFLKDLFVRKQNIFLQHGITKDDISKAYSRHNQNISMFITAAKPEYDSIVSNPSYGLYSHNVELTGFSRFDYLENSPEKIIYVVPTWRKILFNDVMKKNIENLHKSDFYKFYIELLNNEKLIKLIEEHGYTLKFVPHQLARVMFEDFKPKSNNIQILTDKFSYKELFKKGSLFVTDYSSAAFDFAYLKKPLIYCQFDKDVIYSTHTYKQGYFDYERDAFGPVTYNPNDCLSEIEKCINNECTMQKKYINRADKFFTFNDKENCQRILQAIQKYDSKQQSLYQRYKLCLKEHGFKYTMKRVWAKIIGR